MEGSRFYQTRVEEEIDKVRYASEDRFVERQATMIAERVIENYKSGMPAAKNNNLLRQRLEKLARRNTGKKGQRIMDKLTKAIDAKIRYFAGSSISVVGPGNDPRPQP